MYGTQSRLFTILLGLALLRPSLAQESSTETKTAPELLPASSLIYVTIPHPAKLLDQLLEHPVHQRLQQMALYQKAVTTPQYLQGRTILAYIEMKLGTNWRQAFDTFAGEGLHLAFDSHSQGVALLAQSPRPPQRSDLLKQLIQLARDDAANKGKDDPYETRDYRGITAMKTGDALFAELGPWLVIANKSDLAREIADRWLDGSDATLSLKPNFQEAAKSVDDQPAWLYLDIVQIREGGIAKDLFLEQSKDIAAEFLLGGIYSNLRKTDHLVITADLKAEALALHLHTPHDPTWVSEARTFYWGPEGKGTAPAPMSLSTNHLFSIGAYRDIASLWTRAADLFNQKVVDELANADSGLSNLFGGRDFGEDILGAFEPEIQIVGARQDFSQVRPAPAIRLPAFAIVLQLKEAEKMRPELRRTFQSLIGFANVAGASQGQPQLEMDMAKEGKTDFVFSRYLPASTAGEATDAPINFNFSPSIGFVQDKCVISSSASLVRDLIKSLESTADTAPPAPSAANLWGQLNLGTLHALADDNRNSLISQNQLEKGHTKEEAEVEVATLLAIIDLFQSAEIDLDTTENRMTLDATLRFHN